MPAHANAACVAGVCSVGACSPNYGNCDTLASNGCETDLKTSVAHCGTCNHPCAAGQACIAGLCTNGTAENCSSPITVTTGANTVPYTATALDYATSIPSCLGGGLGSPVAPDVVLAFVPSVNGIADFIIRKPGNQSWAVVTNSTCGVLSGTPLECSVTVQAPRLDTDNITVTAGVPIFLHLFATSSPASSLSSPLSITAVERARNCTPGTNGMAKATQQTRYATTVKAGFLPYFVVADSSPTGFIYSGDGTVIYRQPKAGGATQTVSASLTSDQIGVELVVDGQNIYSIDSNFSPGTSSLVWRISNDNGATWAPQDVALFPSAPAGPFYGAVAFAGKLWLLTKAPASGTATQIWSVDLSASSFPTAAVLVRSFGATEGYSMCTGLALDSQYFYTTCLAAEVNSVRDVLRISRSSGAMTVLTNQDWLGSTGTATVYAVDSDADGLANYLYTQIASQRSSYVCDPAGSPYDGMLFSRSGIATPNGLGYDSSNDAFWTYTVNELVKSY